MTREQARLVLSDEETPQPTEKEVDDLIEWAKDGSQYTVRASNEVNHFVLSALDSAPDLVPFFQRREWILLEFNDDVLVTSDEPIALIAGSGEPGERALGLATAEQVVLVTDPRHAIAMIRPGLGARERRMHGTKALADMINRNVAYGAHRWIVQRPGSDSMQDLTVPKKGATVVSSDGLIELRLRPQKA